MSVKVALLHNIIAPYRFPLFHALSQEKDIDLKVFFLSESAKNRKWDISQYKNGMDFVYSILPHWVVTFPMKEKIEYIINPTFLWELIKGKYDVVITAGWLDLSCQLTYLFAPIFGYKYIIWSESTANESSIQRTLTLPFVKWAVRRASACIAIGESSRQYLLSLGAQPHTLHVALSTVDIDHFSRKSSISLQKKNEMRTHLGIAKNSKVVLYVGQFIERKGIDILLAAYKNMATKEKALLLIGYGPLEKALRETVREQKIENVYFVPHVEVDTMPEYYALADVFVLPSREETWGLVVNEAMACGLPVIVSDKVGCGPDLVEEGKNGYVFPNEDTSSLRELLDEILSNEALQHTMSVHSRKEIMRASPRTAANTFREAILASSFDLLE